MKIRKELARGSTELMVLSVIASQDMYGYQIIKTIEERSETVFQMKEGTLYPILHALEDSGCLESRTEDAEGRSRKYYHITEKGIKKLAEQKEEWELYSRSVANVIGGAGLARG